jgi:citronellol/citronellal dehydrogenase
MHATALRSDANAGRVALVSGGGTGIGRATALELAATGARLAICGRRAELLEDVRQAIEAGGGECVAVSADVREEDQVERVVDAALERFGRIDVLVNNAGGQFQAAPEDISVNGWRAVHRLSVEAVWSMTRAVATRSMIPSGGGLIVFVGFSPQRAIPGFAHATAARAAVRNLAEGLAVEWGPHGIRTVHVAPGSIHTEALEGYGADAMERWKQEIPLGRLGTPEEVASVIAFLASSGGAYVSGATITIDGGQDAR